MTERADVRRIQKDERLHTRVMVWKADGIKEEAAGSVRIQNSRLSLWWLTVVARATVAVRVWLVVVVEVHRLWEKCTWCNLNTSKDLTCFIAVWWLQITLIRKRYTVLDRIVSWISISKTIGCWPKRVHAAVSLGVPRDVFKWDEFPGWDCSKSHAALWGKWWETSAL